MGIASYANVPGMFNSILRKICSSWLLSSPKNLKIKIVLRKHDRLLIESELI